MTFDVSLRQGAILGCTTMNLSGRSKDRIERIMDAVCAAFELKRDELLSQSREERVTWPRQIGMNVAYETGYYGAKYVGERFGRRDHGTVLSAVKRVKGQCETNAKRREQVARVKGMLV